jgi:hypothetical protein
MSDDDHIGPNMQCDVMGPITVGYTSAQTGITKTGAQQFPPSTILNT